MKKLSLPTWLNRLGIWIVPLVSITSLPLLLSGWQPSDRASSSQSPSLALPAPSQLKPDPLKLSQLNSSPSAPTPSAPLPRSQSLFPSPSSQTTDPSVSQSSATRPKTGEAKTRDSTQPQVAQAAVARQTAHPVHHSLAPSPKRVASSTHSHRHSIPRQIAKKYTPPPLEIRVAILRDEPNTTIAASELATLRDRQGAVLTRIQSGSGLSVQPQGNALVIDGKTYPGVVWLQPTADGLIYVGDRWYRGKVLLLSQGSGLMAVNYVDLEHYLYSVVGSEMHATAPSEALKAQAIAARSYALVHMIRPASDWFDLGNNQRWQVYKGVNSEFNTTQQAVSATSGQILSYSGGVVESLYAATDEIVARAHGGRGMSQTGAYDLAQQGYDYQRILARYYPGVGLARLIVK